MPGLLRLADSCALSPPRAPVSTRKQETDLGEDDLGEDGQRLGGRVGAQGRARTQPAMSYVLCLHVMGSSAPGTL